MALTKAEINEILNAIKAESLGFDELTQVTTLDGVMSLPAIRGAEVVSAPLSLLRKIEISGLPRIVEINREAEIPISAEGENYNISLGQVLDSVSKNATISYEDMVNMTLAHAMACTNTLKPCRLTVIKTKQGIDYNVGVLDLISDDSAHVLTQLFTTHYSNPQSDGTFDEHVDTKLYTYVRYMGVMMHSIPKTWSEWKLFNGGADGGNNVEIAQGKGDSTEKAMSQKAVTDELSNLENIITIDEVVNMTAAIARVYAWDKKKSRFTVLKDNYVVGALELISDSSGHELTQVLTTHYNDPQSDGSFGGHDDDKIFTYVRHIGLLPSATIAQSWSEWELKKDAKDVDIAQSTGSSTTAVMSQNATTNAINSTTNSLNQQIAGIASGLGQAMSSVSKRIPPVFNPSSYWSDNPMTWTLGTLLTQIAWTSDLAYLKVSGTIVTFQTDGGNWVQYQFNAGDPPVTSAQIAQRFTDIAYWKQVGEIPDSFGGGYVYPERYSSDFYTGLLLALEVSRMQRRPTIDCTYFTGAHTFEDTITLDFPVNIVLGDVEITTKGKNFFNIESNNVSIVGCNRQTDNTSTDHNATTLIMKAEYSASNKSDEGYHIYSHGRKNCQYRNMVLRGVQTGTGRQANNTQYPINGCGGIFVEKEDPSVTQAGNTTNATIIENLLIDGSKAAGIYIDTPILSMIRNVRLSNTGGHGVFVKDGTSTVLESVYVASARYAGFCIWGLTYGAIINSVAERCGCAWWIRSCTDVTLISPGVEDTYNYGKNPWSGSHAVTGRYGLGLSTLAPDGSEVTILDVPDQDWVMGKKRIHARDLFIGYAYVITGGRNINIFTPYSIAIATEIDSNNPKLESTKDELSEMLIMGNCRALTVTNALFSERVGSPVPSAIPYEIRISREVSNLDLSYNPENTFLPTYTSPTPVTADEDKTAPIFCQSQSAFIHCGNKWYSKMVLADVEILGSASITGQIVTDTGIITKGPIVEYDSALLNLILRSVNPLLSTDADLPTEIMYNYSGTKVTFECKTTFALEDVSESTTFEMLVNGNAIDTKVGASEPLSATILPEGDYTIQVKATMGDKVATSKAYYLTITENPDLDVRFLSTVATDFTDKAVTLQLTFEGNRVLSEVGIAYSPSNQAPETRHNKKSYTAGQLAENLIDNGDGTYTYSIDLPRTSASQLRYVRGFVIYAGDAIPAYDSTVYKVVNDEFMTLI